MDVSTSHTRNKLWGVFTRKERWGLSRRGWALSCVIVFSGLLLLLWLVHPFLAVTHRVGGNVLVLEGWVHQFGIVAAVGEFKTGAYPKIYSTGGPVTGTGEYTSDPNTVASLGASRLRKAGVPSDAVQIVASHVIGRDRTYNSAVALRDWFREQNIQVRSINIVTEDAHARRTRLLFQKAFGKGVQVGIIAAQSPDYDPKHWWKYSEGVREVIGETIAYLYARLFFHP